VDSGLYALALAAGLVAAFNPCGFAMLPAYLPLLIAGGDVGRAGGDVGGRLPAVLRVLRLTGAMTAGFVLVFGAFGAVAVPLTLSIEQYLPWATIVIGVVLVGLGFWLLAGRELAVRSARISGGAPSTTVWSMTGYGMAYAIASLSCTIGPLLAILSTTVRAGGIAGGVFALVVYGLGMGLVVGVVSVAVALAQDTVVAGARRFMPYVSRSGGALLVIAGAYVAYYGWYELRVFSGGSVDDPVVGAALQVQGALSRAVAETGAATLTVVLGVLVVAGLALAQLRRRRVLR